jgi:hypothetical protein
MRYVFLLGGLCGFALGAGTAFWSDRSPERVLLDGAVGCLAGALLFRWLWNVLLSGLRDALEARQRAATAAAAAEPARPNPVSPS